MQTEYQEARSGSGLDNGNLDGGNQTSEADNSVVPRRSKPRTTLIDVVDDALTKYEEESGRDRTLIFNPECVIDSTDPNYIRFISGPSAKKRLAADSSDFDYNKGIIVGVIDSHKRSMFVYEASPFRVFWNRWLYTYEVTMQRVWRRFYSLYPKYNPSTPSEAIMIVENPRQFQNALDNERNRRLSPEGDLGHGYDRFYIVPLTQTGALQMRELMLHDDYELYKTAEEEAKRIYHYIPNPTITIRSPYTLYDKTSNTAVAPLLTFDLIKLRLAVYEARNNPMKQYAILCRDWQLPYFTVVVPENVTLVTLDIPYKK